MVNNSMSEYNLKVNSLGKKVFNEILTAAQLYITNFGGVDLYHIKLYDNTGMMAEN